MDKLDQFEIRILCMCLRICVGASTMKKKMIRRVHCLDLYRNIVQSVGRNLS